MKVGQTIRCKNLADMKRLLIELDAEGIEAVVCDASKSIVRINHLPEGVENEEHRSTSDLQV